MGLTSRSKDCCFCFSPKAGTLILLCFEVFNLAITSCILFSALNQPRTDVAYTDYNSGRVYSYPNNDINDLKKSLSSKLLIYNLVVLIIVVAGFFAISKKKPAMLIPYLIIRIIWAVIIIIMMVLLLYLEKTGLKYINKMQSFANFVQLFSTRNEDDFSISSVPETASNIVYFFMAIEILIIILEIHFVKVVYSCYKELDENVNRSNGMILGLSPHWPEGSMPYSPLPKLNNPTFNTRFELDENVIRAV